MNVASPELSKTAAPGGLPLPRRYGSVNWVGVQTLYEKEVRRFLKVGLQTVGAPVVTTLLYMMIFVVAMNGAAAPMEGVSYARFVTPGLIMMTILNNAFANSSSSLIQIKMNGTAPDILTPPLSAVELMAGFGLGAATRGVLVGLVTAIAVWPFAPFPVAQPLAVLYYGLCAALMMGFVGVAAGLWSQKFDHLAAVTNFIVMPMTFLSGTFYLIERLPEPFRSATRFNPFFYLIDGFRYGFIGRSEGPIAVGAVAVGLLTVALGLWCFNLFRTGWRLQS